MQLSVWHLSKQHLILNAFCCCRAGVEASTCTSAADPFIPSHPNPLYESQETTGDSNGEFLNSVKKITTFKLAQLLIVNSLFFCFPDLQFLFTSYSGFLKYAASAANSSCLYCLKYVELTETHLMKRHYLKAVHFILDGTGTFNKEPFNNWKF